MKRTEIKVGEWYAFADRPRSNWATTSKVWVIGEFDIYPGTWGWAATEAEAAGDGAEVRTFTPPPGSDAPIHAPARLFRKAYGKRAWAVAKWVTGRTKWEYAKNEDGTFVLDDAGDRVEVATPIPDQWQVLIVRSDQIIKTWTDYEWAEVARKKREQEQAAERQAACEATIATRIGALDNLRAYGVDTDVLFASQTFEFERWLKGAVEYRIDSIVKAALIGARAGYDTGNKDACTDRGIGIHPEPIVAAV